MFGNKMYKQFAIFLLGVATLLSRVSALNTIKGNLYVNDQLRLKDIIVDPNQSQFIPQKYFQNQFAQTNQQQDQQIEQTEHEKQVDQADSGIITSNAWCEQCQFTNVKVSEKLIGETLSVNVIKGLKNANDPQQDGVITILGDLNIQDKSEETETSNLNINLIQSKSLSINGVRQWTLLDSESFSFTKQQSNSTLLQNGWKVIKADASAEPLKTNEEDMATANLNEKIYKKFEDLPEHSHLKIEGNFYFLSPFWKGESAQIRIDDRIVWLDSHKWTENLTSGIEDMCQMNISDFNQYVWIQPISFVVKHKLQSFEIELGLTKLINEILKCNSDQSKLESIPLFGFDDFSLYIK